MNRQICITVNKEGDIEFRHMEKDTCSGMKAPFSCIIRRAEEAIKEELFRDYDTGRDGYNHKEDTSRMVNEVDTSKENKKTLGDFLEELLAYGHDAVDVKHIYEDADKKIVAVEFTDGSKTKAVCSEHDEYDFNVGFGVCLAKRRLGKAFYNKKLLIGDREFYTDVAEERNKKSLEKAKRAKENAERLSKEAEEATKKAEEAAKKAKEAVRKANALAPSEPTESTAKAKPAKKTKK